MAPSCLCSSHPSSRWKATGPKRRPVHRPGASDERRPHEANEAPLLSFNRRAGLIGISSCMCAFHAHASEILPKRSRAYDAYFAQAMASGMDDYEQQLAPLKRGLFRPIVDAASQPGEAPVTVLELGLGTGPNLRHYCSAPGAQGSRGLAVLGVDPNLEMAPYARRAAADAGLAEDALRILPGTGEDLPAPDGSVDFVVGTLVLCSVQDMRRCLTEIARVMRPGGQYLFIEHVAARDGQLGLQVAQRVFEPLQRALADNCHLTRRTGDAIRSAPGFHEVEVKEFAVDDAWLIAPHVAGAARCV